MKGITEYITESKETKKSIKDYKTIAKEKYNLYNSIAKHAEEVIGILEDSYVDIISIDFDWKDKFHEPYIIFKLDSSDMAKDNVEATVSGLEEIFSHCNYIPKGGIDYYFVEGEPLEVTIKVNK